MKEPPISRMRTLSPLWLRLRGTVTTFCSNHMLAVSSATVATHDQRQVEDKSSIHWHAWMARRACRRPLVSADSGPCSAENACFAALADAKTAKAFRGCPGSRSTACTAGASAGKSAASSASVIEGGSEWASSLCRSRDCTCMASWNRVTVITTGLAQPGRSINGQNADVMGSTASLWFQQSLVNRADSVLHTRLPKGVSGASGDCCSYKSQAHAPA